MPNPRTSAIAARVLERMPFFRHRCRYIRQACRRRSRRSRATCGGCAPPAGCPRRRWRASPASRARRSPSSRPAAATRPSRRCTGSPACSASRSPTCSWRPTPRRSTSSAPARARRSPARSSRRGCCARRRSSARASRCTTCASCPGEPRHADAHQPGVIEQLLVHAGRLRVGPETRAGRARPGRLRGLRGGGAARVRGARRPGCRDARDPYAGIAGNSSPMRAVFVIYLTLIISGIAFFMVIGLTHH